MFAKRSRAAGILAAGALVFAYFVIFPEDVEAVTSPIARLLNLSGAVSPWLYLVIAAGIVAWAIVRVWGPRRAGDQRP